MAALAAVIALCASCGSCLESSLSCASDADCDANSVCASNGGVWFGARVCVPRDYAPIADSGVDAAEPRDLSTPDLVTPDAAPVDADTADAGPDLYSLRCDQGVCRCDDGYVDAGAGCRDVDECESGTAQCDPNAACINEPGSFRCECNPGYEGEGSACRFVDYVRSVQQVQIVIGQDASVASAALPAAVVMANAVVFPSKEVTILDGNDDELVDVYLSGNDEVTGRRGGRDGRARIVATVVEFDPTHVLVQKGTFAGAGTQSIMPVDQSRSFVLFTYWSAFDGKEKSSAMMSVHFAADDAIEFGRVGTGGNPQGHWAVVTALKGQFTVQHPTRPNVAGTTFNVPIAEVEPTRTLLIHSHETNHSSHEGRLAHVSCAVQSPTEVNCARGGSANQLFEFRVQVVELGLGAVTRSSRNMGPGITSDASVMGSMLPPKTMVWLGPTGNVGAVTTDQSAETDMAETFVALERSADGSQIRAQRSVGQTTSVSYRRQVVQWP